VAVLIFPCLVSDSNKAERITSCTLTHGGTRVPLVQGSRPGQMQELFLGVRHSSHVSWYAKP
jgi:hypothetical protein